jgi:clathrin heavy chain
MLPHRRIYFGLRKIESFKQAPVPPGGLSSILQYFNILLGKGTLSPSNSCAWCCDREGNGYLRSSSRRTRVRLFFYVFCSCSSFLWNSHTVRNWWTLCIHDMTLALDVYLQANIPNKVIAYFAETGQIKKIAPYLKKVGYTPDYSSLLQHITRINPEKGAKFTSQSMTRMEGKATSYLCDDRLLICHFSRSSTS